VTTLAQGDRKRTYFLLVPTASPARCGRGEPSGGREGEGERRGTTSAASRRGVVEVFDEGLTVAQLRQRLREEARKCRRLWRDTGKESKQTNEIVCLAHHQIPCVRVAIASVTRLGRWGIELGVSIRRSVRLCHHVLTSRVEYMAGCPEEADIFILASTYTTVALPDSGSNLWETPLASFQEIELRTFLLIQPPCGAQNTQPWESIARHSRTTRSDSWRARGAS